MSEVRQNVSWPSRGSHVYKSQCSCQGRKFLAIIRASYERTGPRRSSHPGTGNARSQGVRSLYRLVFRSPVLPHMRSVFRARRAAARRRRQIIILMTLTPLSELDELIRAGWGDTPQTCIPKDWRERKRAVNTPTRETHYLHGTLTSYRKGGCRCSACCAASSEYYRRTTEERKRA